MTRNLPILHCLVLALALSNCLLQADPAEREKTEAERRKIMRAADMIDVIQADNEAAKIQMDSINAQLAGLGSLKSQSEIQKAEIDKLRSDISVLRTALEKMEAARAQEREVLLKEISALVADKIKTSHPQPKPEPPPAPKTEPKADTKEKEASGDVEKGVYHTVEHGDTLSSIVQAYRKNGFNVSIDDVRAANNMGKKDMLRSGQKLFIPKK